MVSNRYSEHLCIEKKIEPMQGPIYKFAFFRPFLMVKPVSFWFFAFFRLFSPFLMVKPFFYWNACDSGFDKSFWFDQFFFWFDQFFFGQTKKCHKTSQKWSNGTSRLSHGTSALQRVVLGCLVPESLERAKECLWHCWYNQLTRRRSAAITRNSVPDFAYETTAIKKSIAQ